MRIFSIFISIFFSTITDSLMGSASEDEDDDDSHIRGPMGLGSMGPNGPDSVGPIGPSDLSVQSISTDSKTTHDDSDQVLYARSSISLIIN